MSSRQTYSDLEKEFTGGLNNWAPAAEAASKCPAFVPDDEDEQIADDPVSCYNCRYRRWTFNSIVCIKQSIG
jgi:hypothetical protein